MGTCSYNSNVTSTESSLSFTVDSIKRCRRVVVSG